MRGSHEKMTMDGVVETLKYALLGVNVVLFFALVTTLLSAQAKPDGSVSSADGDGSPKKALLVTAHPDDESMFFLPLVHSLTSSPAQGEPEWEMHLLCLSRGNFDGLGTIREREMHVCGQFIGAKDANIHVLEDAKLQDGMKEQWNRDHIAQIVLAYIDKHNVDAVGVLDCCYPSIRNRKTKLILTIHHRCSHSTITASRAIPTILMCTLASSERSKSSTRAAQSTPRRPHSKSPRNPCVAGRWRASIFCASTLASWTPS
jgi:hypothetical protein